MTRKYPADVVHPRLRGIEHCTSPQMIPQTRYVRACGVHMTMEVISVQVNHRKLRSARTSSLAVHK